MSGDQKPPNGSQFDRLISQVSDAGVNLSQPLSDDTFSQLWSHIATDGCLNTFMEPSSWTFSEHFEGGEPVENNVDVQLEHFQFSPPGMDYNGLSQNQPYQPNIVLPVDNAAPGHPMPEYPGDISNTPPPTSAASQALPSNVDYTGDYGFEISLGQPTSTAAKSVSWTYSPSLKKLFVDKDKACPVMFKTTVEPPPGSYIRAMPIFKKPEYVQEPVKRCPNHAGPVTDPSSLHLVTCSDPSAQYDVDPTTQRMSVSVTYNSPQVGTEHTTYLYVFKCFLSCVGGLNRRQIQTVFTLEHNGMVLGRQVIDVRVCACPGRDRKGEEKQQTDKSLKKPLKRGQSKVSQSVNITQVGGKRKKPDEEMYTIMVRGKANYEILMRIKESLELMMYVTQDQRNHYKAEQSRIQQQFPGFNMSRPNSFSSNSSQQQGPSPPRQPSFQNQPSHGPRATQGPQQTFQPPQRQDTLPLHTFSHQQASNQIIRDHCDGPSAMEVDHQVKFADDVVSSQEISSSQMLGQSSPKHQDQAGMGTSQVMGTSQAVGTSQMHNVDRSIENWLANLECQEYIHIFTKKGVQTVDQLDEINLEQDFAGISMPQHQREKLWKAILRLRNRPTFTSTPSSLLRASSNASTASFGGLSSISASQAQRIQATRFTLKQTMSFQVKEEVDDEDS